MIPLRTGATFGAGLLHQIPNVISMKAKITLLISAWVCFACVKASAQMVPGAYDYHELALLFSQYNYKGTARIQGIGGAQVSLGGDLSSALSNPAGLGFYNRSEFSFTPSLNAFSVDSRYLGRSTRSSNPRFNFDQFGVALNKKFRKNNTGFISGTFALNFSKVNEYHTDFRISGANRTNDMLDYYVALANQQDVEPNSLGNLPYKAYQTYLVSEFYDVYDNGDEIPFYARTFFSEFPSNEFPTEQRESVETFGSQNYVSFAYGVNMDDWLYFGANINVVSFNYDIFKNYQETYPSGSIVTGSGKYEELSTDGTGVGLTFGTIVRPIPAISIGASIMTPTWYNVREEYYSRMTANYASFNLANYEDYFLDNEDFIVPNPIPGGYEYTYIEFDQTPTLSNEFIEDDEINLFDYSLTTPMRVNGGMTYFISKYGFISADVEWVNYSKMKLNSSESNFDDQNAVIRDSYSDVINFRIGAEGRLNKFRIRGGYGINPNPRTRNSDGAVNRYTAGAGYRSSSFYIDLAATYLRGQGSYSPYIFDAASAESNPIYTTPVSSIKYSDLSFGVTVGFLFQ